MAGATEVWQRGAVPGYDPWVMPLVHALLQAAEDIDMLAAQVPEAHVWQTPGGAASIGFHVRHMGGALDRLFTYARGEQLSEAQKQFARSETEPGAPLIEVVAEAHRAIDSALAQLRTTSADTLLTARGVGRAQLPSTTLGLLMHAAEHCTRHVGQAVTTAKVLS